MSNKNFSAYRNGAPATLVYGNHRYVLAEKDKTEDLLSGLPTKEKPETDAPVAPQKSSSGWRVRIDECSGQSVEFTIDIIMKSSADSNDIPELKDAAKNVYRGNLKIRTIRNYEKDVAGVLKSLIDTHADDESLPGRVDTLKARIEKELATPGMKLHHIHVQGGWYWGEKNGAADVQTIQTFLDLAKKDSRVLYSHCTNKFLRSDNDTTIL